MLFFLFKKKIKYFDFFEKFTINYEKLEKQTTQNLQTNYF